MSAPEKASLFTGIVTTIIPVYNRASLLREAVASVLAQTYQHIEIIIVDDGSTDDTLAVANELSREHPEKIRVLHQSNSGPGTAREAGRSRARGEFIQYLDSDDLLLPRKFELQVAGLKANPECGISYGMTRYYKRNEPAQDIPWKRTGERIGKMFPSFLESRWWGTSTPLYRRRLIESAGSWTALKSEEDWEYDCRIATFDVSLHYVPEFISDEREHDGPRLSRYGAKLKSKLKDRAVAHRLILEHALKAGVTVDVPEMKNLARELFLLSRQCGAVGLYAESKELFRLARRASGHARGNKWDFKLYGLLASVMGWCLLGKIACFSDGFRK